MMDIIYREDDDLSHDHHSMVELRKSLAASALLVHCEAIAASGILPDRQETYLRLLIAGVRSAFGPSIPERELPENVTRIR